MEISEQLVNVSRYIGQDELEKAIRQMNEIVNQQRLQLESLNDLILETNGFTYENDQLTTEDVRKIFEDLIDELKQVLMSEFETWEDQVMTQLETIRDTCFAQDSEELEDLEDFIQDANSLSRMNVDRWIRELKGFCSKSHGEWIDDPKAKDALRELEGLVHQSHCVEDYFDYID